MSKNFKIKAEDIKNISVGYGGCIAMDMITVEGRKVGYMQREEPNNESDSGWVFMSGLETQEYMDTPENLGIYDVNTIANYDPDIIILLDSPAGSRFERNEAGEFVEIEE